MAEEKVLRLSDILELVEGFLKGERTKEELDEFGTKMVIRAYIPILEKMKIVIALAMRYVYSDAEVHEVRVSELYRDLFFYGMLQGYGNIDCNELHLITFENYDKLFPIFYPYLLSYCEHDYKILREFLHDTLDCYCTRDFVEAVNGISEDAMRQATKENHRFIKELELNKDLIKDLKEIAAMNDPMTKRVVEEVRKIAQKKNSDASDAKTTE